MTARRPGGWPVKAPARSKLRSTCSEKLIVEDIRGRPLAVGKASVAAGRAIEVNQSDSILGRVAAPPAAAAPDRPPASKARVDLENVQLPLQAPPAPRWFGDAVLLGNPAWVWLWSLGVLALLWGLFLLVRWAVI